MEAVFSLYSRPKRGENMPGKHHVHSYHLSDISDFNLHWLGLFWKTVILSFFLPKTIIKNFGFLNIKKIIIQKYWLVLERSRVYNFEFLSLFIML